MNLLNPIFDAKSKKLNKHGTLTISWSIKPLQSENNKIQTQLVDSQRMSKGVLRVDLHHVENLQPQNQYFFQLVGNSEIL
jgi:hypothetical protein